MCEECLNHFAKMDPKLLKAIENNREDLTVVLEKIRSDMDGSLFKVHATRKSPQLEGIEDLLEDTLEQEEDPNLKHQLHGLELMLTAHYIAGFLLQQVPDGPDFYESMKDLWAKGYDDGHAYSQVQHMRRH